MKTRIKVFTSNCSAERAGDNLTEKCDEWLDQNPTVEIIGDPHTNSNKFGWMLTLKYNVKDQKTIEDHVLQLIPGALN